MSEYIEKIRSICGLINSTPIDDYATVMEMAAVMLKNYFNAGSALVFIIEKNGQLVCVSRTGYGVEAEHAHGFAAIPYFYAVMKSETISEAADAHRAEAPFLGNPSLLAPLIANGEPFGLAVINAPSENPITDDSSVEAGAVFSILSTLVYNAVLFRELHGKESDLLTKNEELSLSLSRQQMLLKELHHRVKNNLQIILSIINLQVKREKEKPVVEAIKTVSSRIRSISFVHEKLLWEDEVSSIDFLQYIRELTDELYNTYCTGRLCSMRVEGDQVLLSMDQAVPCGLIVNEAVTNAIRHAFGPGSANPEISVSMRKSGEGAVRLTISDNGAGIPGGVDLRACDTLGFLLMHSLATSNLRGSIVLSGEAGVRIDVDFPLAAPAKQPFP